MHRGGQRGVANADLRVVAARLTAAVGDVGVDQVHERRLGFLRHIIVWEGVEAQDERAVRLGFKFAVGNLPLLRMNRAAAPVMPSPPDRPARLSRDSKFAGGFADRRAGVVGGLALQLHRLAQLGRLFRFAQLDEKLGPLVFLHPKAGLAVGWMLGADRVVAGEPVFRRGETAGEGAVPVGF